MLVCTKPTPISLGSDRLTGADFYNCLPKMDSLDRGGADFDIDGIVTPIKIDKYEHLLRISKFDIDKSNYLLAGSAKGFDIGYRGPENRKDVAKNIPIIDEVGSETEMWEKLMKEVKLGRHAGPFTKIPFNSYIQSPIGLVPKSGNKTRLTFHLSYNFGSEEEVDNKSLNFHTPDEMCSVKYKDKDYAVKTILNLIVDGKGDRCPDLISDSSGSESESDSKFDHEQQYRGHDQGVRLLKEAGTVIGLLQKFS